MKRETVLRQGATDAQRTLLQQVRDKVQLQLNRQAECYRRIIVPRLADHGSFLAPLGN